MAKTAKQEKITSISVRMYRGGTGDFFILQLKRNKKVHFQIMIDCGCIQGGKAHFEPRVKDLIEFTGGEIDLLIVTHEHADHMNGFEIAKEMFKGLSVKKVWFSWTEDENDSFANDLRKNYSELDKAIKVAATKLTGLTQTGYYEKLFEKEEDGDLMVEGRNHFVNSLNNLSDLNIVSEFGAKKGKVKPTMVDLLKEFNVIKDDTVVEFLEPGDVRANLAGAAGIRFYVLGPPKDRAYLNLVHSDDGNFEKRESKSQVDFALVSALAASAGVVGNAQLPFEMEFEETSTPASQAILNIYRTDGDWRKIDFDWLYSAGSLALRYEASINNTSLALAIQFEDSERVMLFPGDAELGNWESWHDGLEWPVPIEGKVVKKNAAYFLNKTVFYKIGHHISQNGTAKKNGIEMMTSGELTAMGTLDFRKINTGWLNTMPNDLLAAEIIKKAEGKVLFTGEWAKVMDNIKTDRVTIKKAHEQVLEKLNKNFDEQDLCVECEITG